MAKSRDMVLVGVLVAALFLSIGCVKIPEKDVGEPGRVKSLGDIAKKIEVARGEEIDSIAYAVRYVLPEQYYEESYGQGPVPEDFTAHVLWEKPNKFRADLTSVYDWSGVPGLRGLFRKGMEASYASIGSNGEEIWIMQNETAKVGPIRIPVGPTRRQVIKVESSPYTEQVLQFAPLLEPYGLLEQFLPLIGLGVKIEYRGEADVGGRPAIRYEVGLSEFLNQSLIPQMLGQTQSPLDVLVQPEQPESTGTLGNLSYEVFLDSETWFPIKFNLYEEETLISSIECKIIEINPHRTDGKFEKHFEVPEGVRVRSQPMKTPYDMQVFVQTLLSMFYGMAPSPWV
jgi:outer membrane lipoprotein-sorting protein